jgi:excisionase family DNA binding protein
MSTPAKAAVAADADGSPATRRHLLAAVAAHCERLRRNGLTPPADLIALAIRASGGLARPPVDGSGSVVDSAAMAPLTLDYRAVADVLSVSERTVRRLTKSGELPAVAIAGSTRVRTVDLAAYVDALPPVNGSRP